MRSPLLRVLTVIAALALSSPGSGATRPAAATIPSGAPLHRPAATASLGAQAPGSPYRFAVIGDLGSGFPIQYELARRMCKRHDRTPFSIVVTTGDNIYPSGAPRDFPAKFLRPYACLRNRGVRFHASLGNHDYVTRKGAPEIREPAFGIPARNYVVRQGGVRFVLANSNALNRSWLRKATRTERGDRWIIVVWHHPVYSPGPHGSTPGLGPRLRRILRGRGVDLVLNGHDHVYSVSKRLKGIRYVVTGGGGASLYPCSKPWFTAVCKERYHFLLVTAGLKRLHITAVPAHGSQFHRWSTKGRN